MQFTNEELEKEATRLLKVIWPMAYLRQFEPHNAIRVGFLKLAQESLERSKQLEERK